MNIKIEEKKIEAIKALEKLGIYEPYVEAFKKDNTICFFEGYAGFWAYQDEELMKKVKEIENKYNCMVYAITHEYTAIGEMYSFLIVTDYEEEWDTLLEKYGNQYYGFAYVWNVDDDMCSEFGTIALSSFGGGIRRIG